MRISLIMPVFNSSKTLSRCLSHLEAQEQHPDEWILVDNGSFDGSLDILRQFQENHPQWAIHVVQESTRGAAAARNHGIRIAKGDILAFIDADCLAHPDWLKQMCAFHQEDPSLDGIGGIAYIYEPLTPCEKLQAISFNPLTHMQGRRILKRTQALFGWNMATGNVSYKRHVFERLKGFDESLWLAGEDVDFTIRAFDAGYRLIVWSPHVLVGHLPRRTVCAYIKQIFQYRIVMPIVIRKHFSKEAVIQIPKLGIYCFPFFMSVVVTQELTSLLMVLGMIFALVFVNSLWAILGCAVGMFLIVLFVFMSIRHRARQIAMDVSMRGMLRMAALSVVIKCVTGCGRIYGSLQNRLLYL